MHAHIHTFITVKISARRYIDTTSVSSVNGHQSQSKSIVFSTSTHVLEPQVIDSQVVAVKYQTELSDVPWKLCEVHYASLASKVRISYDDISSSQVTNTNKSQKTSTWKEQTQNK